MANVTHKLLNKEGAVTSSLVATEENSNPITAYRQVKNAFPEFVPHQGKKTLPLCRKLMAKAEGFTSSFDFTICVATARLQGKRCRMPLVLRRRAIDALLQGMCFYYDPVTNGVQCSATELAIQCSPATISPDGALSIGKATRALQFLDKTLGLIIYVPGNSGGTVPSGITFTDALFKALTVFPQMPVEAKLECLRDQIVTEGYSDE